jgi:hypothetical protein
VAKESGYALDFPNWEVDRVQSIPPFIPSTRNNQFPFYGKPLNAEYGDFYNKGIAEKQLKSQKQANGKDTNPLGPNIPIKYKSHCQ